MLVSPEAEGEGFEPPVPLGTMVFKTTAIDHSAIPLYVAAKLISQSDINNIQLNNFKNKRVK